MFQPSKTVKTCKSFTAIAHYYYCSSTTMRNRKKRNIDGNLFSWSDNLQWKIYKILAHNACESSDIDYTCYAGQK